jgi:hypothetical protein
MKRAYEKPKIEEAQLEILLNCFYDKFTSLYGANTVKLDDFPIYITNRMSFAKAADLNFMYPATTGEGQIVQVHNSNFSDAVRTLEHRGFVKKMPDVPLAFNLTIQGYEKIYNQRLQPVLSWKERALITLNKHTGLMTLVGIPIAVLGVLYAAWSYYK